MTTQAMSTDDFLEHYGVKGMKWGVRRNRDSSGSGGPGRIARTMKKIDDRDTRIENARLNVEKRRSEIAKTRREMKRETKAFSKERKAGRNDIRNMKLDLLNDPDTVTATRMTSGEIAVTALFGVPGTIAARTNAANQIERRQATGYYENKKR